MQLKSLKQIEGHLKALKGDNQWATEAEFSTDWYSEVDRLARQKLWKFIDLMKTSRKDKVLGMRLSCVPKISIAPVNKARLSSFCKDLAKEMNQLSFAKPGHSKKIQFAYFSSVKQ